MRKKKDYLWVVIAVGVVALGLVALSQGTPSIKPGSYNSPDASASPSADPKAPVKKPSGGGAQSPSATSSPKTYDQYVDEYNVGGRRIQFNQNCQMNPTSVTYKNGTKVMLDNRSPEARKVTVGGTSYNLSGYGYQIITLSSSKLPQELKIDCGPAVNVGKILLQARILP